MNHDNDTQDRINSTLLALLRILCILAFGLVFALLGTFGYLMAGGDGVALYHELLLPLAQCLAYGYATQFIVCGVLACLGGAVVALEKCAPPCYSDASVVRDYGINDDDDGDTDPEHDDDDALYPDTDTDTPQPRRVVRHMDGHGNETSTTTVYDDDNLASIVLPAPNRS